MNLELAQIKKALQINGEEAIADLLNDNVNVFPPLTMDTTHLLKNYAPRIIKTLSFFNSDDFSLLVSDMHLESNFPWVLAVFTDVHIEMSRNFPWKEPAHHACVDGFYDKLYIWRKDYFSKKAFWLYDVRKLI